MTRYYSEVGFLQVLHCDHCAISNHSAGICQKIAIECLRRSNQQGVGRFVAMFGRKGLTDVSQILPRSGRNMGLSQLSQAKEIVSISSDV